MPPTGWDLIVAGAGSAGAALAARSATAGKRVLLLEAGPDYRSADMPQAWRSLNPVRALMDPAASEQLVWTGLNAARTEKQPQALYWRGRGAGGSSSINGEIAIRPPVEDFEDWVAAGCSGWSPADVLPYFARLEDDEEYGDEAYHGRGGPIPIFRMPQEKWGAVDGALCAAALSAGYPWAPDVNAPHAAGVSPYPINARSGRRVSVNDAYLEPARALATLTIWGDALVDRVVLSGSRAIGVQMLRDGKALTAYADEVVLSAGAIHSPAILMRSGVGPARPLEALGIRVRQDVPVGQGLQDHPLILIGIPLADAAGIQTRDDRHTNVCVRYGSPGGNVPGDMMFVSLNHSALAMPGSPATAGARPQHPTGAFGVWVNQTYSRGDLTLTSADPTAQPEVCERMLSDERDLSRLRDGVRALAGLARGAEVAAITRDSVESRNTALFDVLGDDAELEAYLLATAADAQHATSTCRMGAASDPGTVVDPSCRVLGTDRLRVVDASMFPSVPRANTNLTAIMVGELMADRMS